MFEDSPSRLPDAIPSCPSKSTTAKPFFDPVAIPIFAFGHFSHHPRIISASIVASRHPFGTSDPIGSLLPGRQGNTEKPSRAYARANSIIYFPKSSNACLCLQYAHVQVFIRRLVNRAVGISTMACLRTRFFFISKVCLQFYGKSRLFFTVIHPNYRQHKRKKPNHLRPHILTNSFFASCVALFHCFNDSSLRLTCLAILRLKRMHILRFLTACFFADGGFFTWFLLYLVEHLAQL